MRYFIWALRLIVFVVILMFAMKNTGPVDVNFYNEYVIHHVPLIVVMLIVFVIGVLFGLLLTIPAAMRRYRENLRLRREFERAQQTVAHNFTEPVFVTPLDKQTSEL